MTTEAPFGTWVSPVGARLVADRDGKPEYLDTVGEEVWWTEPRPREGGRRALMRLAADHPGPAAEVLPGPWDVRNRVIEYGGRPWAGAPRREGGPQIVFTHHADQRLYLFEPDAPGALPPRPLTPLSSVGGGLRWADVVLRPEAGEAWCVMEEFVGDRPTEVRRSLVAVPLDGSAAGDRAAVRELTGSAHRFVTGPRLSPDGRRVAWLAWDHPQMPWDGTLLQTAGIRDDGTLTSATTVAGGPTESIVQAEWAADGSLLALTDRTGWWNVHRIPAGTAGIAGVPAADGPGDPVNLCPRREEFADALWRIGERWLAPLDDGRIAVLHGRGSLALAVLDPDTGELVDAPGPWTEWTATLAVRGRRVLGVAASPRSGYEVVELDTRTGRARVAGSPHRDPVDPRYYPEPQIRTFSGPQGREIHAHVHPPYNPDHHAPDEELPPYVVRAHGGPTGRAALVLDPEIAYFTSRGIGVVEVNYGGSTGWGRAYRNRLREQWGVVDVEDCAAVAEALAAEGTADPERLAIRGGSAGGWTAAVSLVSETTAGLYACAVIRYPVLDLSGWAADGTHDFESQYLATLVGPPVTVPDRSRERSPVHHAERIRVPFLLLQGLDDEICPPEQCERLLARVHGGEVACAYLAFEGEGHGFRRAETIVRAVEAELALYARVFGTPRGDVPPLELSG